MQDFKAAISPLLTAINHVSPTGQVQRGFVNHLHEMEDAGEPADACFKALVQRLLDGLQYGNWPG